MCNWNWDTELKDQGDCGGYEETRRNGERDVAQAGSYKEKRAENIVIANSNLELSSLTG